jgi:hypothetical protein
MSDPLTVEMFAKIMGLRNNKDEDDETVLKWKRFNYSIDKSYYLKGLAN